MRSTAPDYAMPLTYSVMTPVRDEADTLPTLARALASQTQLPERWVIVEGGSRDRTRAVASAIVDEHPWARLLVLEDVGAVERGRRSSDRSTRDSNRWTSSPTSS